MRRIYIIAGLLAMFNIIIFTSCSNNSNNNQEQQDLVIYTSIYPIQFLVEEMADGVAEVKSIYPPGVDAHTYEPKTKEITSIANASAFIYIGGGMESFSESAANALEHQRVNLIEISNYENLFLNVNNDLQGKHLDPHIWLDPIRMIAIAEMIKDELINISPKNEETFTKQFSELKETLTNLDEDFQKILIEKDNKKILVTHAAYRYWEDRYDLEQIAISGLSSSDEPSQKELANITNIAIENNIQFVLFEKTSSNRIATIVQEHIGAEKLLIHPLEVLTEEDIKEKHNYITLMYENLNALDKAIE